MLEMREMILNEEERCCVIITKEYQQPYNVARHHQEQQEQQEQLSTKLQLASAKSTQFKQTPCGRRRYYAALASL
jgi:hypothetical protein